MVARRQGTPLAIFIYILQERETIDRFKHQRQTAYGGDRPLRETKTAGAHEPR